MRAKKAGFTLVELLVVIAIIGLLSSIVLVSLNTARTRSADAAIKSQLVQMRTAAELLYSTTGTYDSLCETTENTGQIYRSAFNQGLKSDGANICISSGTVGYYSTGGTLTGGGAGWKTSTPDRWAAVVQLKNGQYFCVDYAGTAKEQPSRYLDNSPLTVNCQP